MQNNIFGLLELEGEELKQSKNILVCESNTCGNFILNFYVAAFLKGGYRVCLVGLGQSLVHYGTIASKLGVNLSEAQKAGSFKFIDGLKYILEALDGEFKDELLNPFQGTRENLSGLVSSGLKELFKCILDSLWVSCNSIPTLLVVDDLNALLDLGFPSKDVADFSEYLGHLNGTTLKSLTSVWLLHEDTSVNDEEVNRIKNIVKVSSDMVIHVRGLETGYSSDVHGEIDVAWTSSFRDAANRKTGKVMQFKLTDRTVSLFARGTSAAVL